MEIIFNEKFILSNKNIHHTFYHIYWNRIVHYYNQMNQRMEQPVVQKISNIQVEGDYSIIGVIHKHYQDRYSSIENHIQSVNDKLYIEDRSGKLEIEGLSPFLYLSGVVIGVYGKFNGSKFIVNKVYEPLFQEITPKFLNVGFKIVMISELHLNSKEFDYPIARNFMESLDEKMLLIIIGSTFCNINPNTGTATDWEIKKQINDISPIQMLEYLFSNVKCKKIIIPGGMDPTESCWPQPAMNQSFFKSVASIISTTNPASFEINGISFLCCSGEPVHDITNETTFDFHESQIMMLKWRHLAPSLPFFLSPNPFLQEDKFIIDDLPNYFICGDSDEFKSSIINGVNIISIPPFWKTHTAYYIDLSTGIISSKIFEK